jgi:hypothetical protein
MDTLSKEPLVSQSAAQRFVGIGAVGMSSVQIEQKSYEMPPREGFTVTHFITVADIERSARYYEKVFGGRILSWATARALWAHSDRE